nr:aspartate/glutamate racemase family protein [Rhizobium sp. SSA_523]
MAACQSVSPPAPPLWERAKRFDTRLIVIYHVIYLSQPDVAPEPPGNNVSKILVINPNSSASVTQSMRDCLDPVRRAIKHEITCVELAKSPPGIETDAHVEAVIPNILEAVGTQDADAFVLACFSDPGIATVRASTAKPVTGIAESAYLSALSLGRTFGIISLGPSSIARHLRYLTALDLHHRLAGDRSIDMTVVELMATDVVETVARTARRLRDEDKADVIILGCAGLGSYRLALQDELDLPVIDPVQAGVALAANHLDLSYGRHQS